MAERNSSPIPDPIKNQRKTRQTELTNHYPQHVVCEWLGNSDTVAVKHYLKLTGSHMAAGSLEQTIDKSVSKFPLTPCNAMSGDSQTLESDRDERQKAIDLFVNDVAKLIEQSDK